MGLTDLIEGSTIGSLGLQSLLGGYTSSEGKVQKTALQKESGAFKWVEEYLTPDMFATPDSCLIGVGKATYAANSSGGEFELLGCCAGVSFNSQNNIFTLKELRQEGSVVIPLKSMGGSMTLTRMLTANASILAKISGTSGWAFDIQKPAAKKLFGLIMLFMSPMRDKTYATMYFERCSIQTLGASVSAGSYVMNESMQISYSRIKDVSSDGGVASTSSDSSGTNWINQVGREGGTDSLPGYSTSTPAGNTTTTGDKTDPATPPKQQEAPAQTAPAATKPAVSAPVTSPKAGLIKPLGNGSLW